MNKQLVRFTTAVTAALVLPATVQAQTYVGVSTGLSMPNDSKNKGEFTAEVPATATAGSIPSGTSLAWDTDFKNGYNISAQLGHRFTGGFRVEGELNYSRSGIDGHKNVTVGGANIDGADISILTRGTPATTNPTVGAVVGTSGGKLQNFGVFANGYYDFNAGGSFQPYVGGGVGFQKVKVDYRPSDVDVGQGNKTKFAYQLMAGATYKMGPGLEVFGQYNYRDAGRSKFGLDLLPADLSVQNRQSIVSLGLRIPLGGASQ
jgi:opacity protein-like surface antigen